VAAKGHVEKPAAVHPIQAVEPRLVEIDEAGGAGGAGSGAVSPDFVVVGLAVLLLVLAQQLDERVQLITHGQKRVDQLRVRVAEQGTRRL
jgi:hypothetical protein